MKQDVTILSISQELHEAPERDDYGRKTAWGKIKEEVRAKYPGVKLDREIEEKPEAEVEVEAKRVEIKPDMTWLKVEIIEYIEQFKLNAEGKDLQRLTKNELLDMVE